MVKYRRNKLPPLGLQKQVNTYKYIRFMPILLCTDCTEVTQPETYFFRSRPGFRLSSGRKETGTKILQLSVHRSSIINAGSLCAKFISSHKNQIFFIRRKEFIARVESQRF